MTTTEDDKPLSQLHKERQLNLISRLCGDTNLPDFAVNYLYDVTKKSITEDFLEWKTVSDSSCLSPSDLESKLKSDAAWTQPKMLYKNPNYAISNETMAAFCKSGAVKLRVLVIGSGPWEYRFRMIPNFLASFSANEDKILLERILYADDMLFKREKGTPLIETGGKVFLSQTGPAKKILAEVGLLFTCDPKTPPSSTEKWVSIASDGETSEENVAAMCKLVFEPMNLSPRCFKYRFPYSFPISVVKKCAEKRLWSLRVACTQSRIFIRIIPKITLVLSSKYGIVSSMSHDRSRTIKFMTPTEKAVAMSLMLRKEAIKADARQAVEEARTKATADVIMK